MNNSEYSEFDKIACCSDSVRERFIYGAKISKNKVYTLRNFYDFDIVKLANDDPYVYGDNCINLLSVARLSPEKGIDKAIDALYATGRSDINYYIVGDGPQKDILQEKIKEYHMEKQVFLLGEQRNPYRYMINADYLLVSSLHEAAPMVFDEANILELPIISTNTTSANEIVLSNDSIVCETFDEIKDILNNLKKRTPKAETLLTNATQIEQLSYLMNNKNYKEQ